MEWVWDKFEGLHIVTVIIALRLKKWLIIMDLILKKINKWHWCDKKILVWLIFENRFKFSFFFHNALFLFHYL